MICFAMARTVVERRVADARRADDGAMRRVCLAAESVKADMVDSCGGEM
jgi:hypothetical protein